MTVSAYAAPSRFGTTDVALRLCVGASSGGHLSELLELAKAWEGYSCCYVSTLDIATKEFADHESFYVIGECNRQHLFRTISVAWQSLRFAWKERPDVVLTTGSFPMAILCLVAKAFRAKVIWVDSLANVDGLSASGRFVLRFADLFITQWPHLERTASRVEYAGKVA